MNEPENQSELNEEVAEGGRMAESLVHHLLCMGAAKATIPVSVDGKKYIVVVSSEPPTPPDAQGVVESAEDELLRFAVQAVRDLQDIAKANGVEWMDWSSPANTIRWGQRLLLNSIPTTPEQVAKAEAKMQSPTPPTPTAESVAMECAEEISRIHAEGDKYLTRALLTEIIARHIAPIVQEMDDLRIKFDADGKRF